MQLNFCYLKFAGYSISGYTVKALMSTLWSVFTSTPSRFNRVQRAFGRVLRAGAMHALKNSLHAGRKR